MRNNVTAISTNYKYFYMVNDKKVYCVNVKIQVEEINILTNEKVETTKNRLSKQTYEELEQCVGKLCDVTFEKVGEFTFYTFKPTEEVNVDEPKGSKVNTLKELGIEGIQ